MGFRIRELLDSNGKFDDASKKIDEVLKHDKYD